MFDSLQLPKEIVDLLEHDHYFVGENSREHWQIVCPIVKLEDFPTSISRTRFKEFDIQSMKEFLVMILSIT